MAGKGKSSLSGSRSYQELSEYWDTHSLADHWKETSAVEFEVDAKSSTQRVTGETSKAG